MTNAELPQRRHRLVQERSRVGRYHHLHVQVRVVPQHRRHPRSDPLPCACAIGHSTMRIVRRLASVQAQARDHATVCGERKEVVVT